MEKNKKLEKKDGFMKGVLALMISQAIIKMLGLISKIFLTNKENDDLIIAFLFSHLYPFNSLLKS